jgi:hypothetical protein
MWVKNSGACRSTLGVLLLSAALGACGAEGGQDIAEEQIVSHEEALVVADKIFTDASGDVKVMVRTCDYPANLTTGSRCHFCAVDQGWVMIGGGAEIEGSPSFARLRGSFPFPNNLVAPVTPPGVLASVETCTGNSHTNDINKDWIAWMVRSGGTSSHRLRGYVVGLQVTGVSETTLASIRLFLDSTATGLTQPSIEQAVDNLIGGGANEVGAQSCYLTESRPVESNGSWRGSAYCSPAGNLKVYAISFDPCMLSVPGWDYCLQLRTRSIVTGPTTGYGTASLATAYPWVTTTIGATGVVNSGSSRFLADLLPLVGNGQGVTATTKDHITSVSGTTTAYSIDVFGGRWGTWRFNSVRFNTAGTSLYRPSGAAPVSLQQSTGFPDSGLYRWYLEPFGTGQYRLRNANPNRPAQGECAFRQSGTSNVQVGPCGTGNDYRWTATTHPQNGPFKLRNVSANSCLDNNLSTTDSTLRLATCASGYSDRQSLFLDTYSWPP